MLDLNSLRSDKKASEEGTWATYFGGKFLVARYNNDKATQLRAKLTIENFDVISKQDDEALRLSDEINAKVMSEAVLLDWQGVGIDGKEVKFSVEAAYKFLSDPELRDFYQFIENYSLNRSNYQTSNEVNALNSVKSLSA